MKARIAFYFAAVVALVLFLAAAVPSRATQHRDPALSPENMQKSAPAAPAPKPPASAGTADSSNAKPHQASGKNKKQSGGSHRSASKAGR